MNNATGNLPQKLSSGSGSQLPERYTVQDARVSALACRTVSQALAAPTIRQLERHTNSQMVGVEIMFILKQGMELFGAHRAMNMAQCGLMAEEIQSRYPHESLADIALFMRGASMGHYGKKGQEGETFGPLDPQRLFIWFREYLEEKAIAREQEGAAIDNAHEGTFKLLAKVEGFAEMLKSVNAEGKAQREAEREGRRLSLLRDSVKHMHDDDLRQAYSVNRDAQSRSIITAEAVERGLFKKKLQETKVIPIDPPTETAKASDPAA